MSNSMIVEKVLTFSPRDVEETEEGSTLWWRGQKHGDLVLMRYLNLKIGNGQSGAKHAQLQGHHSGLLVHLDALNKISFGEFVPDRNKVE